MRLPLVILLLLLTIPLAAQSGSGTILYRHDPMGNFTAYTPVGALIGCLGSTTSCLQEALDYAHANGYCFDGEGGEITNPAAQPPACNHQCVSTKTPITINTTNGSCYTFNGIDLAYDVGGGADPSKTFITIDSADRLKFWFLGGSVIYPGNANAVLMRATHSNAEPPTGYTGHTISDIRIASIPIVNPLTFMPEGTHGTGFRVQAFNGTFINNDVWIGEINGGAHGYVEETPAPGQAINLNRVVLPALHGQGVDSLLIGTDGAAAGRIYGNDYDAKLSPLAIGASVWGGAGSPYGGDHYKLAILGGTTGVLHNYSAQSNSFTVYYNAATVKYTDNSITKDWHGVISPGDGYRLPCVPFAALSATAENGHTVCCSDCNSTCTAGNSVGRTCFRENGVWTH